MKIAFEGQEIGNMKQLEAGKGVAIEEGKINVALPVEVLSADEYAALPEEEKRSETLYGVPEPPWTPLPETLSIQDYETEDGWHVRKWSDGYLEMSCRETVNIAVNNALGNMWFYKNSGIDKPYPIIPTAVYSSNVGIIGVTTVALAGIYWSKTTENRPDSIYLLATDKGVHSYTIGAHITGRWK